MSTEDFTKAAVALDAETKDVSREGLQKFFLASADYVLSAKDDAVEFDRRVTVVFGGMALAGQQMHLCRAAHLRAEAA